MNQQSHQRSRIGQEEWEQRWMSIRKLKMANVGRRPALSTKLHKRDGEETDSPEEVKATWHQHFTKVLNIPSEYCQEVLDDMPSCSQPWTTIPLLKN